MNDLFRALVREDLTAKKQLAAAALESAKNLISFLTYADRPEWLKLLDYRLTIYNRDIEGGSFDFLECATPLRAEMSTHNWFADGNSPSGLNFDAIFEQYRKESRLPELFDEIIQILESILGSGEVDSIAMQRALERMISTLKGCKGGSYFNLNSTWEFLLSFLKNYLWEEASKIPGLGSAVSALKATIADMNEEMFKLHVTVKSELEKRAGEEVKNLKGKAEFNFPTYNKSGRISVESESSLITQS